MKKKQTKTQRQVYLRKLLTLLFLTIGGAIACYPFYVNGLNHLIDQRRLRIYQEQAKVDQEKRQKMEAANEKKKKNGLTPGVASFKTSYRGSPYKDILDRHLIGTLAIPAINVQVPVFDELNTATLLFGAGVLDGTSYPLGGEGTHSVISAHSGLPERKLFTDLGKVNKGEVFVLTIEGEKLAYQVDQIRTVLPDDTSLLKLIPGGDVVTLLTCTPYMINSHRLLVRGHRVPYTAAMSTEITQSGRRQDQKQAAILLAIGIGAAAIGSAAFHILRKHQLTNRRFDLAFRLVDEKGEPVIGEAFLLTDQKGRPLYRDEVPYQIASDEQGGGCFTDLPGGIYGVRSENHHEWSFFGGIKRRKKAPILFVKKNSVLKVNDPLSGCFQLPKGSTGSD